MKKNSKLNPIRAYLRHQMLHEAEALPNNELPVVEGNDSLDAQVDRYLHGYEAEATNIVKEGHDMRAITQRFLFEAPDDDKKDNDAGDDGAGDDGASEEEEDFKPTKKSLGEIDVRSFAGDVARLITNVQSLIETKNTILRRSINYLGKSYDKSVIRQLEIVLEDEHGLVVGKSEKDIEDDIYTPPAANAGPISG